MSTTNNIAYTALINPPGASPPLTLQHIWPLLQRKVARAEDFVPQAIKSTTVLSTRTNAAGQRVTEREAHFVAGHTARETVTEFVPTRLAFVQADGAVIQNIVSMGSGGELLMTYTFEWRYGSEREATERVEEDERMAKVAVEGTIEKMREMVRQGKWAEGY